MAERRSAAIAIGGRKEGDSFDVSALSQSLPCKPGSLAREAPVGKDEPPPLELPSSVPSHDPIDEERGRTLIRFNANIEAEEFSCTPAQREVFLSQSCPTWSTFDMPGRVDPSQWKEEAAEEAAPAPGAMAVPGSTNVESVIEADVNIIGRSPTILESFKMYNGSSLDEPEVSKLEEISEEVEPPLQDDDDEEDQFALDA